MKWALTLFLSVLLLSDRLFNLLEYIWHIPNNVANILSNFESYISLFLCSPGIILQLKPGSYSVTNLQKLHTPHKCPSFWFTPQEVLLTSQNLTDIFPVIHKLFVFADLIPWIWSFDALYCIHTQKIYYKKSF